MKKAIRFFVVALMAACAFTACSNDSTDEPTPDQPKADDTFVGTLTVYNTDDTTVVDFTDPEVTILVSYQKNTINMTAKQVKFADKMPMRLDMDMNGITYTATQTANLYTLSGNGIIPEAMGGPFPTYTVNNLTGYLSGVLDNEQVATSNTLSFKMMCGTFPVSFLGTKQ